MNNNTNEELVARGEITADTIGIATNCVFVNPLDVSDSSFSDLLSDIENHTEDNTDHADDDDDDAARAFRDFFRNFSD